MQIKYTDLNIRFSLENASFTVLNMVFERFLRIIPKHSHSSRSYEIHYIPRGYGRAVIDGTEYAITPNTLFITGPGIAHEQLPEPSNPMEEYCIYLKMDVSKKKDLSTPGQIVTRFETTPFWFGQDQENLGVLMQQLFYEMEHKSIGYRQQVESLLQQCIIQLVRNYLLSDRSCKEINVKSTEHTNLYDQKYIILEECFLYEYQNITLSGLADRLGLSTRQTERLLKEHYGKTFLQKKSEARMSAAAILLVTTKKSITEISMELGYSSIEHFSNAFRNYYHVSAGNFRKKNT